MALGSLNAERNPISDLSPLKGMPLAYLNLANTSVSDLSPLQGMTTLGYLELGRTPVADLSPLKGMKIAQLGIDFTRVTDLSPLRELPLVFLLCDYKPERDAAILRSIKTLDVINGKPPKELLDAPAVALRPLDDAWLKRVAALPPEKQVEEVAAELKARNPKFDGKVTPTFENGVVTGLQFSADGVTDITPVRALPGLKSLNCSEAEGRGAAPLADLSPLKGMALTTLYCNITSVSDLSPLKGMPLTTLDIAFTHVSGLSGLKGMSLKSLNCTAIQVSDLSPLQGMPLEALNARLNPISDLSPLKGLPLQGLHIAETEVSDLSPLQGMTTLTQLNLAWTPVSDLSPLKGMNLGTLAVDCTRVTDLSVLREMPLAFLTCDFKPERDGAILLSIKTLENINGKPAKEFWKEVDEKKP